jgi:hypothetical protein
MNTVEIIRLVVGVGFILYGLGFNAYEKFNDMKFIDQINGVINGKVCIIAGVLVCSFNLKFGIILGIIAFLLWIIEEIILNKKMNKSAR